MDDMTKELEKTVIVLSKRAQEASSENVLKYTQAALNAVNALNVLKSLKST